MITFSWNSVPNATAYSVAWAPTLSGNKKILVASQAATSYSFDGSHVDDPYYVNRDTYMFVRALDGSDYVSSDWASVVMQMREVSIAGSHVSSTLAIGDYRVVVGTVVPSFTITPDKGYQLTAEDISIVNNGVDITSQVYNANTHTVSSFVVNGSVQVLATAVQAQLAAPVISLSGSVVSWAAIPDAESYKLYVDGQFTVNLGNELSVDLSQVIALKVPYTVNVLAHARGFKDSELSNTISYTPKPDAPVLTLNGNILSWTAIPSATKYTLVAISNSLSLSKTKTVDANTTSLDLTTWTDLVPSSWTIGAIAYVGDVRSDTSATVTYVNTVQLAAPTTVNLTGKVLTWNNVANNSGYEILYRRVDGAGEIYQTDMVDANVTQHTLTVTTAGTYSVTIVTLGTGSYTDSEESAAVTYTVQAQLAAPTIAMNADGKTLEITDVENATSYDVYVDGTLKTNVVKTPASYAITFGTVTGSHTPEMNGSYYNIKFDDGSYLMLSSSSVVSVEYYDANGSKIGETAYDGENMATRFGVGGVNSTTVEYYGRINSYYDSVDYGYFTVGNSEHLSPTISSSNPHTTKTVSGELNIYGKYPD